MKAQNVWWEDSWDTWRYPLRFSDSSGPSGGAVSLLLRGALLRCFFVKALRENEHQLNQHDLPESTSNKGHIICPWGLNDVETNMV